MSHDLHHLLVTPYTPPTPWVEGGILWKGSILMFGGTQGVGKTYLTLELIRNMAEGGAFLGLPYKCAERPRKVLYLDGEIGLGLAIQRIKQVFNGCTKLEPGFAEIDCHPMDLNLDRPEGRDWFLKKLASYDPVPDIVIIDPLSYFMEGEDSDNMCAKMFYKTLVTAQQKLNPEMSFILSHHYRKKPTGRNADDYDPLDPGEFRGASKWMDQAWTAITLDRQGTNPDGGWDLDAKFAKIRASMSIEEKQYLTINGVTMRCTIRRPPGATWG